MSPYTEQYDDFLQVNSLNNANSINVANSDEVIASGTVNYSQTTINTLKGAQDIKSDNFVTGSDGWRIAGNGDVEFNNGIFRGSLEAGEIHIPDSTTTASFHVDDGGNAWWGANETSGWSAANAYVLNNGAAKFSAANITGTSTVGGTLATTIGAAINSAQQLITSNLNTYSKQILGEFTFSGSGALKIANDDNNGVWISPNGILGKKGGNYTFTIGTDGTATFYGTLSGASGTFGEITSGTITGALIRTNNATYPYCKMDAYGITMTGTSILNFITTGGLSCGWMGGYIYGSDRNLEINNTNGIITIYGRYGVEINSSASYNTTINAYNIALKPSNGGNVSILYDSTGFGGGCLIPTTNGNSTQTLGNSSYGWGRLYLGSSGRYLYDNSGYLTWNGAQVYTTSNPPPSGGVTGVYAGSGISVNQNTGNVTVTNSGVRSLSNSNSLNISSSTGSVSVGLSNDIYVNNVYTYNLYGRNSGPALTIGSHINPSSGNTYNFGSSSNRWYYLNVYGINKVTGFGFFDEGVELQDGTIVSDVESILQLKEDTKHAKTHYGKSVIDVKSLPKCVYIKAADNDGNLHPRDENDRPYIEEDDPDNPRKKKRRYIDDGEDVFAMMSIMIGAIKELGIRMKAAEAEIEKLKLNNK